MNGRRLAAFAGGGGTAIDIGDPGRLSEGVTFAAAPAVYYKFANSNRYVDWWGIFGSVNLIDSPNWSAGPITQPSPRWPVIGTSIWPSAG